MAEVNEPPRWLNWFQFGQEFGSILDKILKNQEKMMTALDDLTAAVSGLSTEITTFLADVASQISGGVTADQAEAIVQQINGFTTQLQAADPANPAPVPPTT
jgi:hypothetical protein